MRRLLLRSFQSPGDVVMLTAAVRDLHKAHPGRFQTDVRTSADDIWRNNPWLTPLDDGDPTVERIDMHYPLIHESNQRPYHFIHGYPQYLESRLGLQVPLTEFRGDIHLADDEKTLPEVARTAGVTPSFWIIVAGGKYDFTAKWWNPESYQAVVDHFGKRIQFVQCGEDGHWHQPLRNCVNLVGRTSLREFIRLVYHADGIVCPVTLAMHLAAAVETPPERSKSRACVVVAGGREPTHWEAYPHHRFLSTHGALPCCRDGGCWKSRCQTVGDGDRKDQVDLCVEPVPIRDDLRIPRCMDMITSDDAIRAIEMYYQGGVLQFRNGRPNGQPHSSHTMAATAPDRSRPVSRVSRATPITTKRIAIQFEYGPQEAIEFTLVLQHLRHYFADAEIELLVRDDCRAVFDGFDAAVRPIDPTGTLPVAGSGEQYTVLWHPPSQSYAHWAPTAAIGCLREQFRLSPIPDLCHYTIRASASGTVQHVLAEIPGVRFDGTTQPDWIVIDETLLGANDHGVSHPDLHELAQAGTLLAARARPDSVSPWSLRRVTEADETRGDASSVQCGLGDIVGLLKCSRLAIAGNGILLRLAAATSVPAIAVWKSGDDPTRFDPAFNVRHAVPAGSSNGHAHWQYFEKHNRITPYESLGRTLSTVAAEELAVSRTRPLPDVAPPASVAVDVAPAGYCQPAAAPVDSPATAANVEPCRAPRSQPSRRETISVRFHHGLGDCAYFAHLIPLYTRRGYGIEVECTPDKRILFEAAGAATIESGARQEHAWGYPPGSTHSGHGRFWQGSKMGHNISESPLPHIGDKSELWDEYCRSRVETASLIPSAVRNRVDRWLDRLPRPIMLLHTKGNTAQHRKSLPDAITALLYRELIERTDATLVLLDWDRRVPTLASHRVRHLDDFGGCSVEDLLCLMTGADLILGVDSGPLHLARFTHTPTIGVWMPGHYPATYALPRQQQLNVVLAEGTQPWNRFKRIPWNIVEHPGHTFDAGRLADTCRRMLNPPRYLHRDHIAADVQLQHFVEDFCRCTAAGSGLADYWDRTRSLDVLLCETASRFDSPTVVETGTIRSDEDWGGTGFFTYLAGAYLHCRGGRLLSVDIDAGHCAFAREWTAIFGDTVTVHQRDSVAFLQTFADPIDVLYLDSLDTTEPNHAAHAQREVEAALPRLHDRSLIVLDDTPWHAGAFTGKGAQAVPWLLKHGWSILYAGYQVVLTREAT